MSFLKAHLRSGSKSNVKSESQVEVEAQAEIGQEFFNFMPEDANGDPQSPKDNLLDISE